MTNAKTIPQKVPIPRAALTLPNSLPSLLEQQRAVKIKSLPASMQRSLAGKYALWIQVLSLLAFTLAFLG